MAHPPVGMNLARDHLMTPDDVPVSSGSPETHPAMTIPAKAAFALGVVYLLLLFVATRLPAPGGAWASVVAIMLFVYLPLGVIYQGVKIPLKSSVEIVAGLISLGVWLAMVGMERAGDAALIAPTRSVALLTACLFFGMFASRIIRERNLLIPACIVAAGADILSVGWGFTGHAVEHAPDLVTKLSVAVPTMATAPGAAGEPAYPVVATMGVGDLFFVALFLAAAARFALPLRRTFCFIYPLVVIALALTVMDVLPWRGVPGLPFITAGFLAANTRSFSLSRQEWRTMGIVGFLLALAVASLLLLRHVGA